MGKGRLHKSNLGWRFRASSNRVPARDLEEAKKLATAEMQAYAKDNFDLTLFKGPESVRHPPSIAYGFDWTHTDKEGEIGLIALVEEHGSVLVSGGALEPLRHPQK